jgi:hypothetical protein
MEHTIVFGGAPHDVTITTSGPASRQGLIGFVRDLVDDARFRPGMSILVDHLALDGTTIMASDVRALAAEVLRLDERLGATKVAIVVPTPLTFGYARMYELHAADAQVRSRVFYVRADAVTWLGTYDDPPGQPEAAPA